MDSIDQQIIDKQAEILKINDQIKAIQPLYDHTAAVDESLSKSAQIEVANLRRQEEIAEIEYELLLEKQYAGTANVTLEDGLKRIEDLKLEIAEAEVALTEL